MGFTIKEKNFVLEFEDIGFEDAMNLKDAVTKHFHSKNTNKIGQEGNIGHAYNLSLNISNDKAIRQEVFTIIRKYAKKFNKIQLNEDTALGFIFADKKNWEYYGVIYQEIYKEAVAPFLNLPISILSTFTTAKSK